MEQMIMQNITEIVALLILLLVGKLIERADSWLKANKKEKEAAALDKLIDALVAAAEQMFKADDADGSKRLNYVEGMLIAEGYDLTETILAMIESKVYALNLAQRK